MNWKPKHIFHHVNDCPAVGGAGLLCWVECAACGKRHIALVPTDYIELPMVVPKAYECDKCREMGAYWTPPESMMEERILYGVMVREECIDGGWCAN